MNRFINYQVVNFFPLNPSTDLKNMPNPNKLSLFSIRCGEKQFTIFI